MDTKNNIKCILFYYAYDQDDQSFTGGPRGIYNLVEAIDRQHFIPILVTQKESLLTKKVAAIGISVFILPFPPLLDIYNEKALRYTIVDKFRAFFELVNYNLKVQVIIKEQNVDCVWARNIKSVIFSAFASLLEFKPIIWDVGLEKKSGFLFFVINLFGLVISRFLITEFSRQPQDIFGSFLSNIFQRKFITFYRGVSFERISAIENARESRSIEPSQAHNKFTIINVSTINPRKNQLMLLRAINLLIKDIPDLFICSVGDVSDNLYYTSLKEFIKSNDLQDRVEFLGWRDDIPELMANSSLFVISSHAEGLAYSIAEAMFSKLPVIASNVGGVSDLITHGTNGFLVEDDDYISLAKFIKLCYCQPSIMSRFKANAYETVVKKYSIESFKEKVSDILTKAL